MAQRTDVDHSRRFRRQQFRKDRLSEEEGSEMVDPELGFKTVWSQGIGIRRYPS
jgi:hypothetical protein